MKKLTILCFLIPFILMTGCNKEEEIPGSATYDISGKLYMNTLPVKNVKLNIDDLEQYKTTTDDEGRFLIENVSAGDHKLNAVFNDNDQSFSQRSFDLVVNTDLILNNLKLPNPVTISCTLDSLTNIVTISWNKSDAEDFREYKLYSHSSSGLDETTGTLEHVATDANDTIMEIQLESYTKRYFRVFVMNDMGQLGGSNIISATSSFINLLTYGDFEDSAGFFATWEVGGNVSIVDSNQINGDYCLLLQSMSDTANNSYTVCSFTYPQILLQQNEEYELSFWYKWKKGISFWMYPLYFYYTQDNERFLNVIITPPGEYYDWSWILIEEDLEWTYYSVRFYPNSASSVQFYFEGSIDELYFDDLKLKKVM
jgi:hypothetical protein